jgi:hypothetical protein
MFGDFKERQKDRHPQSGAEILTPFHDRLPWISEHQGEYFRKWHMYKSAMSWARKNSGTFSLLFDHTVF